MPEETPPSTDGGQASTSGLPQAGTPTTDGQAPVSQPTTDHERVIAELRKENAAARKRLDAFEQAQKDADLAKLTEQEKLQKERDDLQARNEDLAAENMEYRVNQDVALYREKLNILLPADMLANLINWKEIEWDEENGKPTNIEKLLEKIAKRLPPELIKQQQQAPGTPTLPAMNPGRSSITQPGGNVPGKRYTLDDIQWSR